jgi:integrase
MVVTKRIDRVFAGVGRIAIASGTTHAGTFKRINAALTAIAHIGKLEILAALRDGKYAPLVVLHYYERGQLDKLPTTETAASLAASFRSFAETHEASVAYRADLMTSTRKIEVAAKKGTPVADAAKVLRTLKGTMRATPVAFNKLRAHLLAFASEVQGKYSPLWNDVAGVPRFKKLETETVKAKQRRPLTVAELDLVCAAFVDWPVYGGRRGAGNQGREKTVKRTIRAADLAAMARTLATTGMRPKEYWQREANRWEDRGDHVWVEGKKTRAAKRPTFRLVAPTLPACGEQFFRARFAEATEQALREGLDAYSLRRTFAAWCESARLEPSRREAYMGHGPKTVSDLYLQTKVLPFVVPDGETVATWIAAQRALAAAKISMPTIRLEVSQ